MTEINEDKMAARFRNRCIHMTNERIYLAWIRTSIGIMTFNFVVEKFALFIKQMPLILGKTNILNTSPPSHGYPTIDGVFLVAYMIYST